MANVNRFLQFNDCVCYDVSQLQWRLRYLFRVECRSKIDTFGSEAKIIWYKLRGEFHA